MFNDVDMAAHSRDLCCPGTWIVPGLRSYQYKSSSEHRLRNGPNDGAQNPRTTLFKFAKLIFILTVRTQNTERWSCKFLWGRPAVPWPECVTFGLFMSDSSGDLLIKYVFTLGPVVSYRRHPALNTVTACAHHIER